MLDAPGLVDEDYRRAAAGMSFENWAPRSGGAIEFVNRFSSGALSWTNVDLSSNSRLVYAAQTTL